MKSLKWFLDEKKNKDVIKKLSKIDALRWKWIQHDILVMNDFNLLKTNMRKWLQLDDNVF